ncbi:MAG TPA: 4-hydroxythreonine-4-phosphate dehydrogenase PdxA [Candidatus Binataceae bacterium]|nr:4-hydroxythreonine-4-phosphate dehydrogenase PdxA [Candidatus Binataceae bacterium]
MGDPAGIGPEVILKSAAMLSKRRGTPAIVVAGDLGAMRLAADSLRGAPKLFEWHPGDKPIPLKRGVNVWPLTRLPARSIRPGHPSVTSGAAAFEYVVAGAQMAMHGEADALVTAPISKEWMNRAGHHYPGHSELLAELGHARKWRMMFAGGEVRLALVTVHLGLAKVSAALNPTLVLDTIRLLSAHLRTLEGLKRPRIAVLGFNPHAGEHGMFGDEETRAIEPGIRRARRAGIDVFGPLAPDTAFIRTGGKFKFDAAVAMYHDQGLIPLKTLEFDRAVNITLGIPFIRTSPDHGTAFDIAGKGIAVPSSMIAAIEYAARTASRRDRGMIIGKSLT